MPRTEAGRVLTEEHRRSQLQLEAQALRDFIRLWPIWRGDEESFDDLVTATITLLVIYRRISSSLAASYFESFRRAERVPGESPARLADPLDEASAAASLHITGREMTSRALRAGQSPERAMQTAQVRMSGTVTREVLDGGREALLRSIDADPQAIGWARVTDNDPCAFCAVLASRGPVFKSRETARFNAHDHCSCGVEPHYEGAEWPGRAREFRELYNEAVREAEESGELRRGTSNDLLNAFRRHLNAERN